MNSQEDLSSSDRSKDELKGMVHPDKMMEDDFDMKGTSRKEYENEYYKRVCSEVIEGFLFLGSDFMARDE